MTLSIHKITVGQWFENTYLLIKDKEALIVDPGDEFSTINTFITQNNLVPLAIINTHGHFDHLGAVHQIKELYSIPFYIHSKDRRLVTQANLYRKFAGDNTVIPTPKIDNFLDDISELEIGSFELIVNHIPGHTDGSVSFLAGNHLFSGDLIFENAIGRTDLPGGNAELLNESINKVFEMHKGTIVYPGHGEIFELNDTYINKIKMLL